MPILRRFYIALNVEKLFFWDALIFWCAVPHYQRKANIKFYAMIFFTLKFNSEK